MDMIARKSFVYAARRLMPEDRFTAKSRRDARLLVAIGRARIATSNEIAEIDDLTALRADYQEVFGKRPFNGWDADTLRARIAAAIEAD